jgi:hypothetical protein
MVVTSPARKISKKPFAGVRKHNQTTTTMHKLTTLAPAMLAVTALGALTATAQLNYLDASSGLLGNTTLADGSPFTPPLNGTTGLDNNWEQRTTFGSGGNIFEAGGETAAEDAPELRTTISGLTPGGVYQVYGLFWDPTSTAEDWSLRAGFTSNPGANTLFSAADATVELGGATAAVVASTLSFTAAPTIFSESSRALLAGLIGNTTADGSGNIHIFVDDRPAATSVNLRTWYDGVAYQAVPEPTTAALAGLAVAGVVIFRRRQA